MMTAYSLSNAFYMTSSQTVHKNAYVTVCYTSLTYSLDSLSSAYPLCNKFILYVISLSYILIISLSSM